MTPVSPVSPRLDCFAIAAPGLEPLVARELTALGETPRIEDGGVSWSGDARSMMRANLWLRTASRVLVRVARFRATEFYELEKRAKKIPWGEFVFPGHAVEFRVTARKSRLYHSDAIAERLSRSVGASAKRAKLAKASAPRAGGDAGQLFVVRVVRDEFEISVDSSGDLLHQRGYRRAVAKAPLRETLAAALLLAAEWTGDAPTPLVDPMCGSGTIPIEGALIARRIAPGIRRGFAFESWPGFQASVWTRVRADARANELASARGPILGSDRDAGAVESALANAERAGVTADVTFRSAPVSAIQPPGAASGLVATNPPYGVRVGSGSGTDLRNLYAQLGNVLRERFSGWRLAMYSPESRLTSQLALPVREAFRTSNGGIKVAAVIGEVR
ncbi:MAG: class I SAM-dependent RNA methyltransferase [Gemmatimonadaceae bacterium]